MDELYRNPRLVNVYDVLNGARADFDFYSAQLPAPPAAVADLGSGTGTFAIDLARRGYRVTGIEPASEMLAHARTKDDADAVAWVEGTAADVSGAERYDAIIMTGHAFQCLLRDEDVADLFADVARLLTPGGAFLFETRNPAARAWERWTPEHVSPPVSLLDGGSARVIHRVEDVEGEFITFSESYDLGDTDEHLRSRTTLRFMPAERITDLAAERGLATERIWGTWSAEPYDPTRSPEIIFRLVRSPMESEEVC